jgi:hypothetical protein
VGGCTGGT